MKKSKKYGMNLILKLTTENYHSQEANLAYLSVSQYKDFMGCLGMRGCEAMALAKLNGEWIEEVSTAMLVGSYVDSHFEGTLNTFKAKNPELFKKDGGLKSEYTKAEEIIQRIERDEYFMKYLSGEKQIIFTAELFGAVWKCKIDSLGDNFITDLKIMRAIREKFWVRDYGAMSFVSYWGYDLQGAIYRKIVELNTGKTLPFFIAAASKEKETDIEIIGFTEQDHKDCLSLVHIGVERVLKLKAGEVEPDKCGICDYCKHTKKLTKPIHFSEIEF